MDLSTTYLGMRLPHPLIVGAGPLGDDLDTVRALEDAGAALLVLRSLYEEEITGEQMDAFLSAESHNDSFAEAGTYAPDSDRGARSRRVPGPSAADQICRPDSGHGVAQWRHAWRMDFLRQTARGGRRGRPRAPPLSRRQRHDVQRRRRRASGGRDRAGGEAQPPHSGRRQTGAAPHRLRALRQPARWGRRRWPRPLHALPSRRHRRRRARSDSHAPVVGLLGAAAASPRRGSRWPAASRRPSPSPAASIPASTSSRPRWPARTPRRWFRRCFVTAPIISARSARTSSRGCRNTNGAR